MVVFFVEGVPGQKKGLPLAQATVVFGIDVQCTQCAVVRTLLPAAGSHGNTLQKGYALAT